MGLQIVMRACFHMNDSELWMQFCNDYSQWICGGESSKWKLSTINMLHEVTLILGTNNMIGASCLFVFSLKIKIEIVLSVYNNIATLMWNKNVGITQKNINITPKIIKQRFYHRTRRIIIISCKFLTTIRLFRLLPICLTKPWYPGKNAVTTHNRSVNNCECI